MKERHPEWFKGEEAGKDVNAPKTPLFVANKGIVEPLNKEDYWGHDDGEDGNV